MPVVPTKTRRESSIQKVTPPFDLLSDFASRYTAGIRTIGMELQEQMDARLAVLHTQEAQELEREDLQAWGTGHALDAMDAWVYEAS